MSSKLQHQSPPKSRSADDMLRETVRDGLREVIPDSIRLKIIVVRYRATTIIVNDDNVTFWADLDKAKKHRTLTKGSHIEVELGWPKKNAKGNVMVPVRIDGLWGFVDHRFAEEVSSK